MPISVLVVDDSSMLRALIRRALRLSGANVLVAEASNGREALTVLETERIDAVFTDLNMPVMSGTELLREMATLGCETCSTLAHPQVRLGGLPAPEEDTIVLSVNGRPTVLRAEFE